MREIDSAVDAEFIFELLNTPKFLKYIGDRGVRSVEQARDFIEGQYRRSYHDHGYGLYTVEIKSDNRQVGLCGFVRRATLPGPDLGFAFLPEFEGKGYGFESARAVIEFGHEKLGFARVWAITSLDNDVSAKLLGKLGFKFDKIYSAPECEDLKLFEKQL